jgi:predicted AlkP superfamily phosphohydrolase/phosphomutase/Flp pilus assembly protein TadD
MRRLLSCLCGAAFLAAAASALSAGPAHPARPGSSAPGKPRVIVVGWDGADWSLLDPLLKEGRLPHLKALLEKGAQARLETYRPRASPLLWTTMATGLTPPEHGVVDFQEFDVATGSSLPVSGRSRTGPAIWNVASAKGLTSGVVGWWATWPAEAVKGFFVSDRASPVLFDAATLSQSPGLTWPPELAEGVRLLGRREGAPSYEDVAKFVKVSRAEFDAAVAAGKDLDDPITGLRKILGSTRVYARTALDLYDRNRPELLMVYLEGTDEIGHVLGKYNPPLLPGVDRAEFEKYKDAVALYYGECDRILGEFASRAARDGATLMLVSDHGFKWGADRPALISSVRAETAYLWHEPWGVFVLAGPGAAHPAERRTVSVFDVAPILCRLLGLPPDARMKGRVPSGLLAAAVPAAKPAVSWERTFKVERAAITRNLAAEKKAGEEFAKKLVSLGYLSGSSAATPVGAGGAGEVRMTPFGVSNIGVFYAESGRVKEAVPWFEKAIAADPATPAFHINLADAYEKLGKTDAADVEAIKAAGTTDPDANDIFLARVVKRMEAGHAAAALALLEKATRQIRPPRPQLQDALGRLYFDARRCPEAQRVFEELSVSTPQDPGAWLMLGRTRRCNGDVPGAREALERASRLGGNPAAIAREMQALGGAR